MFIAVQSARATLDVAKGAGLNELKVHTFIGGMSLREKLTLQQKIKIHFIELIFYRKNFIEQIYEL